VLLIVILSLMAIDVPEELSDGELLGTANAEIKAFGAQSEDLTAQADELTAQEEEFANLVATATAAAENSVASDEMATLEAQIQQQSVLATSQALSLSRMDSAATTQAEAAATSATAQAELAATATANVDARATTEAGMMATATALAEQASEPSLAEAQLEELQSEIDGYQAEATTRAQQLGNLRATATAEAETDDALNDEIANLEATASAQADVIATQQAQLDAIRDTLESLGGGD